MSKFIITSNGHAVSHIPSFGTLAGAEQHIHENIGESWAYDAKVVEVIEDSETATATALLTENAELKAENARLKETLASANSATNGYRDRVSAIATFLQNSIDRDEWDENELSMPFWAELAEMLDLDLKQTEEIDITVTITYSGTVTVPKGTDVNDLVVNEDWHMDVEFENDTVGQVEHYTTEFTRD